MSIGTTSMLSSARRSRQVVLDRASARATQPILLQRMKTVIGIDNGSTGTVGIITPTKSYFFETPTTPFLHYGKRGTVSNRIDRAELSRMITEAITGIDKNTVRVMIERPFTAGPMMIKAMLGAHRCFEATICVLEDLGLGYEVVDSGTWQDPVLGSVSGSSALKQASMLRGMQMYPQFAKEIKQHKDADGLLIAHHFAYRA